MEARAALRDDYVRPFRLAGTRVRGRLVRLGPEVARILDRHAYPDAAAEVLGESLAIAAALAQSLKAGGIFTLQVEGDGAIRRLVADIDATGLMRGFAGFDGEAGEAEAAPRSAPAIWRSHSIRRTAASATRASSSWRRAALRSPCCTISASRSRSTPASRPPAAGAAGPGARRR